jgi:hypothetical protein
VGAVTVHGFPDILARAGKSVNARGGSGLAEARRAGNRSGRTDGSDSLQKRKMR